MKTKGRLIDMSAAATDALHDLARARRAQKEAMLRAQLKALEAAKLEARRDPIKVVGKKVS